MISHLFTPREPYKDVTRFSRSYTLMHVTSLLSKDRKINEYRNGEMVLEVAIEYLDDISKEFRLMEDDDRLIKSLFGEETGRRLERLKVTLILHDDENNDLDAIKLMVKEMKDLLVNARDSGMIDARKLEKCKTFFKKMLEYYLSDY